MRKELFGALLGGALLAACTSDDVLNVSVSQDVNPQAPVFTVSVGDIEDTRAGIGDGTDVTLGNLYLEENDVMSLFHGVSVSGNSGSFTGYGNAVYQGAMKDDAFEYTTKSMVNEGYAVMVFPADTTFVNNTPTASQPYVEVSLTQTKKTTERTPFISEIIEVNPYNAKDVEDGKTDNMAGYGHKYDLKLKRAAATMALAINAIDENPERWEKVGGLDITSIKIEATSKAEDAEEKIFASQMEIGIGEGDPHSKDTYENWKKISEAKAKTDSEGNAIEYSFADNEEGDLTAYYTLLPFANDLNELLKAKTDPEEILKDVTITVYTNYGYVQFTSESEDKIWTKNGTKMTILEGVVDALKSAFAASTGNTFKGETVGRYLPRTIDVTLGDLVMNDLHIQNETQLINVMTVYNGLTDGAKEQVENFFLDGTNGEFTITSKDALDAYDDALEAGITFTPCDKEGEVCSTVVLKRDDDVPARLEFVTNKVAVRFEGNWTLNKTNNYSQTITQLEIAEGATLTLNGTKGEVIGMKNAGGVKYNQPKYSPWLVNNGTVNVNGEVNLQMNTENYGTINIPAGATLRMEGYDRSGSKGVVLNNMIQIKDDKFYVNGDPKKGVIYDVMNDDDIQGTENENKNNTVVRGRIILDGVLGTTDETGAKINNYGYIKAASTSTLMITTNAYGNSSAENNGCGMELKKRMKFNVKNHALSDGDNVAGIVDLGSGTMNTKSTIDASKGFILSSNNAAGSNDKNPATYLKLTSNAKPALTAIVQIEVDNDAFNGESVKALIVPEGVTFTSLAGKDYGPFVTYLAGNVSKAGGFTLGENYWGDKSYFGGDEGDWRHVTTKN